MVATSTIVGAGLGLFVQLYSNAVMKLPLMRNPWQHVVAMGAGAAFTTWLVKFEKEQEEELAVMLRKRAEANARLSSPES